MHVLVEASHDENLVVVTNWLGAVELLWFLERAIHSLDLATLCVKREAVRNPSVVSAEDQNFLVVESKAAHSITWRP